MAPQVRREAADLKSLLLEKTRSFEFTQAVRLFHKIWGAREPVGHDVDPSHEVVHFQSDVSSVFPAGDVDAAVAPGDDAAGELTVSFLGVATPASWGSLPRRYAEEVRRQERVERNRAPRDFLDLFNHRLISLFYRAVEKNHPVLGYESRSDRPLERVFSAVLGLATPRLSEQLSLDERLLIARAGLLAMQPMPVSALEAVLRSVFGYPVEIEQFVPGRYRIEDDDLNQLGRANCALGRDLHLGAEVRLVQSRFCVRVGPLDRGDFDALLPDRPGFHALVELVHFAVGAELDFEVELTPSPEAVRPLHLQGADTPVHRLGWSSWLAADDGPEPVQAPVLGTRNLPFASPGMLEAPR